MKYICDSETCSVILSIDRVPVDATTITDMEAKGFQPKDEFHITLVSSDAGLDSTKFGRLATMLADQSPDELDYTVTNELYHVSKPKITREATYPRESLLAPVVSPSIHAQLDGIYEELDVSLPPQFLHVTVATRPDTAIARRGIGIPDETTWQALRSTLYTTGWQA